MFIIPGLAIALVMAGGMTVQSKAPADPASAALERLGVMVGGQWEGEAKDDKGKPFVSLKFEWGPEHKTIRGSGTIAGMAIESRMGWDAAAKKVYYLDLHGADTVYFGHYTIDGDGLQIDFKALVGTPGDWHAHATLPDRDTYVATIQAVVDGKLKEGHGVRLHRVK